jgi:P27 family predicted phage terminase small subunit
MKKLSAITPPEWLSKEAQTWWERIVQAYGIQDEGGLLLLGTALEALDRMREAQARLNSEGLTVLDKAGQPKPHPLLACERDSRQQMLVALKHLNLDVQPLKPLGRPPG